MTASSLLVKICGVTNAIDAQAAIAAGADAIGFVMGGKVLPPEVEPAAQAVRAAIKRFPAGTDSFLVTHLTEVEEILALADYIGSTGIQVSEDIGPDQARDLRSRTSRKIIKTIVVDDEARSLERLRAYEPHADFLLLDTRHGGYTGGTGVTNDWGICRALVAAARKPVYLAGGLTPENVRAAAEAVHPQGLDVSTGVSVYGADYRKKDRKDERKIKAFLRIAKQPYEA